MARHRQRPGLLESFSEVTTRWAGQSTAFGAALGAILVWLAVGPFFRFSDGWQLVINTATTIVTFLMVFLIQRTQNKTGLAVQLKLNELVAAIEGASNRLIGVEDLTEDELSLLHKFYGELAQLAQRDQNIAVSHSVEEARRRHRLHLRAIGAAATRAHRDRES